MSSAILLLDECGCCGGPAYGCGDYPNVPTCVRAKVEGFTSPASCGGFGCPGYQMYPNGDFDMVCQALLSECGGDAGPIMQSPLAVAGYPQTQLGEIVAEGKWGVNICITCVCWTPSILFCTFVATSGDTTSDPTELEYEYYSSSAAWDLYFGTSGTLTLEPIDCPT